MSSVAFNNNSTHFDLRKHIPITPYSVPLAIWDCIEKYWEQKSVVFTEEYPRDKVDGPTIVWSIYRKLPGRDGLESLKARYRQEKMDLLDPTISHQLWAQWITVIYEFELFDTSNPNVNSLSEQFEEFMLFITLNLQKLGVQEWYFDEQLRDEELKRVDTQDVFKRVFRYRCIMEKRFIKDETLITEIWLQSGPNSGLPTQNEMVTRSQSNRDNLENSWVSKILAISDETQQEWNTGFTQNASGYVEGIDFNLDLKIPQGTSSIVWTSYGKHPMPGQSYYVSYLYRSDMGIPIAIS